MATFPQLKTTAIAQYPMSRAVEFQNQTLRFLDGNEQRYREASGALHKWMIRLDELDEYELAEIEAFCAAIQGRFGSFAFVDPWDGTTYTNCSLADDYVDLTAVAPMRGRTSLTVVENRV